MYRKVVFSKEPTALKLESLDNAVFLHMKHASRTFALGGTRDQFGVYPAGTLDSPSTLHRAYFKVYPVPSASSPATAPNAQPPMYQLSTDQIRVRELQSPTIHLGTHGTLFAPREAPNQLHFQVAAENGVFQFGAHADAPWISMSSNGIHLHGDLHCRRVYTDANASALASAHTLASAPAHTLASARPILPLDADGKIPREYLPEVYTTSVLNPMAGAGVGIGTSVPTQKLHVEGSAYVRDRMGVGVPQPTASLHLSPAAATPGLRIDTDASTLVPALELYARGATTAAIALSPTNAVFEAPVSMTTLRLNTLAIDQQFYTETHRVRFTTPVVIQAPLTLQSSIATEDASPLRLIAPSVLCDAVVSPEWVVPLTPGPVDKNHDALPVGLQPGFKGTYFSANEGKIDIHETAWCQAYADGDEMALLTMPDATHLSLRRMVAVLWDTVQKLSERVKELEENQMVK